MSRKLIFSITAILLINLFNSSVYLHAQDDDFDSDAVSVVEALPDELRPLYEGFNSDVHVPALADFVASEPPWKFCFSDSYQGNPWRVAVRLEFERLVDSYQNAGYIEDFLFLNADNDVPLQNAHILQFVEEGCDIIFSIPGNESGLDEGIQAAFEAGIPVVTGEGSVTNPNAVTVTSNFYQWGFDMATAISEELNGDGNVLLVEGLRGNEIAILQREGALAGFEQFPGINVLGTVNGDWTPNITKQSLREILEFINQPIDGVWTTGSEAQFVAEAFAERGLPPPLITASISGDALAYWHENQDTFRFYGHGNLPDRLSQAMFRVGTRILLGQTPKINIIMLPLPEVSQENLEDWYEPCMQLDSLAIFPIPPDDPTPDWILDAYFEDGETIPAYNYAEIPRACERVDS
jgi:ribose transport system substrate-binding protein